MIGRVHNSHLDKWLRSSRRAMLARTTMPPLRFFAVS
jgi:hypothetical protein